MISNNIINYFNNLFVKIKLSKKQTEVALWMLHGFNNEHIAFLMNSNVKLVKQHVTKILFKSKCKTRYEFLATCYLKIINDVVKSQVTLMPGNCELLSAKTINEIEQ